MAVRPSEDTIWANSFVTEVNKDGRLVPNRYEPPEEVKLTGIKSGMPFGRQWFNWQFYIINKWVEYLKDLPAVNDVVTNTDNVDPATKYGFGVWVYLGSTNVGGTDIHHYKRES